MAGGEPKPPPGGSSCCCDDAMPGTAASPVATSHVAILTPANLTDPPTNAAHALPVDFARNHVNFKPLRHAHWMYFTIDTTLHINKCISETCIFQSKRLKTIRGLSNIDMDGSRPRMADAAARIMLSVRSADLV
jgi:hypothetical protein